MEYQICENQWHEKRVSVNKSKLANGDTIDDLLE